MKSKQNLLNTVMSSNIKKLPDPTQRESIAITTNVRTRNDLQGIELGVFEEIDFLEYKNQ